MVEAIPPVVIEFYILPPVHCLQTLHASGSMLNFIIREYQNTLRYRLPAIKVNLYFVNFFLFKKIVVYLFLAVLGLHCCVWVFSSCGEQRLLSSCGAWAFQLLWLPFLQNSGSMSSASVVVAHWA